MKTILDQTANFIKLYGHHTGQSEVPPEFHDWTCLSLLAACVADRVWLEKFKGQRLCPNLYTFLVGPSGLGKGLAIDVALNLVRDQRRVNVYQGKATAQYLWDFLGRPINTGDGQRRIANPKVYLVTPELAMSVGEGGQAKTFITHMTELYTGTDYPLREGTRTRGAVLVTGHRINWLAGTTRDWLIETVPRSAVTGGFFGRTVAVEASYDLTRRFRRPIYPADFDLVYDYLRQRIVEYTHIEGEFSMTPEAEAIEEAWYMNRQAPTDEALLAGWKREHDLTLKLAMLFSLADDLDLVIHERHIALAQKAADSVMRSLPALIDAASTTVETAGIQVVVDILRTAKKIHHSTLLQRVYRRGINADRLREIINTLFQARQIVITAAPGGGQIYLWGNERRALR